MAREGREGRVCDQESTDMSERMRRECLERRYKRMEKNQMVLIMLQITMKVRVMRAREAMESLHSSRALSVSNERVHLCLLHSPS